jgi:hypothetical protein
LEHNQVVERAYVKASPAKFFLGTEERDFRRSVNLCLKITNHGTTPARITDVLMRAVIIPNDEALPEIPHYKRSRMIGLDFWYPTTGMLLMPSCGLMQRT